MAVISTLCLTSPSAAQSSRPFQRLGAQDGLSQASVTSIAQDALGIIWMGTQDGLNRFDGYDFTVFRHDPAQPTSLGSSYVNDLLVDRTGTLWIATFGGLSRYVQARDEFETISGGERDSSGLPSTTVRTLYEDRDGNLWAGTHLGLARLDPATNRFQTYLTGTEPADERNVRALTESSDGRIWIGTNAGLRVLDPVSGSVEIAMANGVPIVPTGVIWSLFTDQDGQIWVGTDDRGLLRVDAQTASVTRYRARAGDPAALPSDDVRSIYEDSRGEFWVGTFDGLSVLDRGTDTFTTWTSESGNVASLSQNSIWSIAEDFDGTLWFGTMTAGANTYNPNTGAFANYRHRAEDPASLPSNVVYEVRGGPDGTIWIGTRDGGLSRFDPDRGILRSYRPDPGDPSSLSSDYVVALDVDARGIVWIGNHEQGVNRLDPRSGRMQSYRVADGLSSDWIRDVLVDPDGSVWVGTSGSGLSRLNPETGRVEVYMSDEPTLNSLSSNYVRSLLIDRDGALWVGTYGNGANLFNRDDGTFTRFTHDPGDPSSIGSPFVRSIFEDSSGRMWFSTDAGLSLLDESTGRFTRYGVADGLPNAVVYGMLEDDAGNLWMSTNDGLARFDPVAETFTNLNVEDGLPGREFNTGAFYEDPSGRMYFGGVNGLTVFHPDSVKLDASAPRVVLTDFQLFNQSVEISDTTPLKAHIAVVDEIRLESSERVFSFEFAGLNYRYPQRTRYAYRLVGFDDRWITTPAAHRRATFTNLPPGDYVFEVRTAVRDGAWGPAGASVRLTRLPAIWETIWFRGIVVLLIVAAAGAGVTWRHRDLVSRNVMLESRVRERTDDLERNLAELKESMLHIKRLEGLLPICASCKQIRTGHPDSKNQKDWVPVEVYISDRTDANFSHGICPDCTTRLYPELTDD